MDFLMMLRDIDWLPAVLLIAGIVLLVVEMFTAGFGAAGIGGIVLLVLDIFLVADSLVQGLLMFLILACLITALFLTAAYLMGKGKWPRRLILSERESGYSSSEDRSGLLGQRGTVATDLRPAGSAVVNGVKVDVVSSGEFIPNGTPVEVTCVEGNRVVVKRADND